MHLCRFHDPQRGVRLGLLYHGLIYNVSTRWPTMTAFLQWSVGCSEINALLTQVLAVATPRMRLEELLSSQDGVRLLKPTDEQEIWAAGVTYERSRIAREEESAGSGIYDRVYTAERPEIFFKATPSRTVGPQEALVIRADSRWNVPEPELGLVINPALELLGFTIGNDMSSRDIEGENPLYLPQAKMYARCCAVGPFVALRETITDPRNLKIQLHITRDGSELFSGEISTSKIVRRYEDLISYLGRDNLFPEGVILLTGTGIVPPDHISIEDGDLVAITIEGIGTLTNPIVRGTPT